MAPSQKLTPTAAMKRTKKAQASVLCMSGVTCSTPLYLPEKLLSSIALKSVSLLSWTELWPKLQAVAQDFPKAPEDPPTDALMNLRGSFRPPRWAFQICIG